MATGTATARKTMTALRAARQTKHDGDGPETAELCPGKKEQRAAAEQLEQAAEDDPGEEERRRQCHQACGRPSDGDRKQYQSWTQPGA